MLKTIIFLALVLFSCFTQANAIPSLYQIDLIIFTHPQSANLPPELSLSSTLSSESTHAAPLQTEIRKELTPYHLLPFSSSQLREEYWALHRRPEYRVLLHYTWLQPFNSQRAVSLPKINRDGWQLEGALRIQRSSYYLLNTELLFSPADSSHSPFVFAQKQRLKGGETYYFDHPQAGMLIKIHQLG
ncbi:CsiV family protein [Legionella sp.]|uniref:CsiV family protein n=1 Tax=Legionella sp. TaxID=459 RepID=UPI003220494D